MKRLLILFLLCVIVLSGCKSLTAGTIIDKSFVAAHSTYSPRIVMIGKTITIIPHWIHHPDRWYIEVQDGDITDMWEVSEDYYNSVNIGDYVEEIKKNNAE